MGNWMSTPQGAEADEDTAPPEAQAQPDTIPEAPPAAGAFLEELPDDATPPPPPPAHAPAPPQPINQLQLQIAGPNVVADHLQVVPVDFFHNGAHHFLTPEPGAPLFGGEGAAAAPGAEREKEEEEEEENPSHLVEYVLSHLEDPLFADCELVFSDGGTQPIPCHRLILARAPPLAALGAGGVGATHPAPPHISPAAVRAVLRVLYGAPPPQTLPPHLSAPEAAYYEAMLGLGGGGGLPPLQEHLGAYAGAEAYSDARVRVGCGADVPVHRLVVCSRCFFRASLSPEGGMAESVCGEVDLAGLVDVDLEGLSAVLRFLYSEDPAHVREAVACKSLLCAHVLSMCDVVEECARELQDGVRSGRVAPRDLPHLLHLADHAGVLGLRYVCVQQATKVLEDIQSLEGFALLPRNVQEEVRMLHRAERDYLQGLHATDDSRLGCGRELLAILQDSLVEQRDRLTQARQDHRGAASVEQDAKVQDLLVRQERRLHDLDTFIKRNSALISAAT